MNGNVTMISLVRGVELVFLTHWNCPLRSLQASTTTSEVKGNMSSIGIFVYGVLFYSILKY